jgi:hypothetical protein
MNQNPISPTARCRQSTPGLGPIRVAQLIPVVMTPERHCFLSDALNSQPANV